MYSPISRLLVILAVIALSATGANAQGSFVLEKVFYGQRGNNHAPISWDYVDGAYIASFSSVYRSGCVGSYRVMFSFDRDIRVIPDGGQFQVMMRKLSGHAPCGFKKSRASVTGANNLSASISPEFPSSWENNGSISGPVDNPRIHMWQGGTDKASALMTVRSKKDITYTAFALVVSGPNRMTNYLVFLYRYENAASPASTGYFEQGTDRPGMDYRSFFQAQSDPSICEAACTSEARCRAWTWVRPGVQGTQSKCWLKHSIPAARKSDCCTSGTKLVKQ